jgi:hypothetical protein
VYTEHPLDDRFISSDLDTLLDLGSLKSQINPFDVCFDPNAPAIIKVKSDNDEFFDFDNERYTLETDTFEQLKVKMLPVQSPEPLKLKICY